MWGIPRGSSNYSKIETLKTDLAKKEISIKEFYHCYYKSKGKIHPRYGSINYKIFLRLINWDETLTYGIGTAIEGYFR